MPPTDLEFLNSLSLDPTSAPPSAPAPASITFTELSPFSDLPTTETGELDLSALDEADVDELLRRMEDAETAADGLESRLDGLLSTLDGMLGVLGEGTDEAGAVKAEGIGQDARKVQPSGEVVGLDEAGLSEGKADA